MLKKDDLQDSGSIAGCILCDWFCCSQQTALWHVWFGADFWLSTEFTVILQCCVCPTFLRSLADTSGGGWSLSSTQSQILVGHAFLPMSMCLNEVFNWSNMINLIQNGLAAWKPIQPQCSQATHKKPSNSGGTMHTRISNIAYCLRTPLLSELKICQPASLRFSCCRPWLSDARRLRDTNTYQSCDRLDTRGHLLYHA